MNVFINIKNNFNFIGISKNILFYDFLWIIVSSIFELFLKFALYHDSLHLETIRCTQI